MDTVERKEQSPQQRRRRRRSRGKNRGGSGGSGGTAETQKPSADKPSRGGSGRTGSGSGRGRNGGRNSGRATSNRTANRTGGRSGGRFGGRGRSSTHSQNRSRTHGAGSSPSRYTSIETSAGGLVVSGLAEAVRADNTVDLSRIYVALIGRLDRRNRLLWSMPKGHVEPGEAHDITAEREVWEETGIHGIVLEELGVIDYWFVSDGKRIHKTVHHHLLRYVDGDLNDEDPEVTEVTWVPADTLVERLAYADERKLARLAHDRLPDLARAEKRAGRATPR